MVYINLFIYINISWFIIIILKYSKFVNLLLINKKNLQGVGFEPTSTEYKWS